MSRVPRIRFKGFEEDWEQRKLSEVYKNICNAYVGTATPYYVEDGHFYLEANNVKDGKINYNSQIFINDNFYESQKDKWLNSGDIVMVQSGHVGHAAVIPKELENTVAHALIIFKNAKIKIEPYFLNYQYQTLNFKRKIENITVGNTIKHILASDMKEYMVYVSRFAEQSIVSKYFQTLDHLITLHQRKLEKLKIIKKSMLENLFPQSGEKTPKIRFSGFTKDWEQRKLGEIIQERNIRTSDFDRFPIFSLTIESGITPKTERYERSSLVTKTEDLFKVVKPNEFVTNPMNLRFGALGYNAQKYEISVSGYYDVFSIDDNNCSGFWNAYFKTYHVMNVFDNVATGSLVEKKRVKYSTLKQISLSVPINIEEKNKISKFMIFLDHLITLHQSKLDKLQKIKKSMLESMFV